MKISIPDDDNKDPKDDQNPLLGFVAIMMSCCTSGFAGVYFEKVCVCVCVCQVKGEIERDVVGCRFFVCCTEIVTRELCLLILTLEGSLFSVRLLHSASRLPS